MSQTVCQRHGIYVLRTGFANAPLNESKAFTILPSLLGSNKSANFYARLHRKTLCYSKSVEMLRHSIHRALPRRRRMLLHYLKFGDVPVPE
jgi:hypothetical protein